MKNEDSEKKFDKQQYINDYNKGNYKQLHVRLKPEEYDEITKYCKKNNLSYKQFILASYKLMQKIQKDKNTK